MFSVTTSPPPQHDHTMADNETKLVKMNGITPQDEDFVFGQGTNSAQASRGFGGGTAVNFEDDIFMDAEMGLNMTTNTFTTATSSGSYTEATNDNDNADSETSSPSKPPASATREPPECPLTGEPLVDPVVNPTDGVSYERSAIVSEEEKDLYYPNRALKEYIEALQETAATTTTSRSTDTDEDDDNEQDPPKQSLSSEDLLDIFVCPITQELLRDPVIDPEGNTYERSAVINWIQQHGVSPITRENLTVQQLYDNTTLFVVLMQEIQLQEEQQRQNDEEDDTTHNNEEVQQWKTAVSGSTDATETTAGDSEMLMMSSSLCLEDFQPQGQLQDLEAAHEVPNLLFPELAAVPEEQRRRGNRSSSNRRSSSGRRSSSSSSRRQSQRRPPPPIHYDTPDVNDLVRREQQIARSILHQMERDEQRKNRRKTCLIWAFLFVSMVCMMVGLFFVYQLAAFVFLLAILIFIAMSFCIGGMPCEFTSGTAGLSGALNAI